MPTDLVHHSGMQLYDKRRSGRVLFGSRTIRGAEFHTVDTSRGRRDGMGPEVYLDKDQMMALRNWLTKRIDESSDV